MRINNLENQNFKGLSPLAKPLSAFYNPNAVIPILAIEAGVTLGRTYEAAKMGGRKEATERFVEQGVSAAVWLWGVQAIRKLSESAANVLKGKEFTQSANFKNVNSIASTALATVFIGFILPKINHFISEKLIDKGKKDKNADTTLKPMSLEEYRKQTKEKNSNISFKSLASVAALLENNATARLLATDTGVIAGRFKNGRNKYERIEGLFRDISSIYFYLFSTKHIVKGLNKLTGNKDISPEILEKQYEYLKQSGKDTAIFEQFAKSTINKNFAFYSIGTLLSTFALGILIPKVQYAIRHKLTNKDEFPGEKNYSVSK